MAEVAARERERRSKELEERQEREKLAEGGELPGHIREPVMCDLPDEVPAGEDLYVHCVPSRASARRCSRSITARAARRSTTR